MDKKRKMCQNNHVLIARNLHRKKDNTMQASSVAKGAAVGIAAGCVTCLMSNAKHQKKTIKSRAMKKKAGHAFRTVGAVMDDIAHLMQ